MINYSTDDFLTMKNISNLQYLQSSNTPLNVPSYVFKSYSGRRQVRDSSSSLFRNNLSFLVSKLLFELSCWREGIQNDHVLGNLREYLRGNASRYLLGDVLGDVLWGVFGYRLGYLLCSLGPEGTGIGRQPIRNDQMNSSSQRRATKF